MELDIRNQDKSRLVKPESIYIRTNLDTYEIYAQTINSYILLGTYPTKERALEVLDDIQNTIFLKNMYEQDKELVSKSWNDFDQEEIKILRKKIVVYEMPKE